MNDPSLTAGGWEAAEPNGTLTGFGEQAAPDGGRGLARVLPADELVARPEVEQVVDRRVVRGRLQLAERLDAKQ